MSDDWQYTEEMAEGPVLTPREARDLRAERDRYRQDLERLMEFGKRLLNSDDENERSIGWCICEGARVVEE